MNLNKNNEQGKDQNKHRKETTICRGGICDIRQTVKLVKQNQTSKVFRSIKRSYQSQNESV